MSRTYYIHIDVCKVRGPSVDKDDISLSVNLHDYKNMDNVIVCVDTILLT